MTEQGDLFAPPDDQKPAEQQGADEVGNGIDFSAIDPSEYARLAALGARDDPYGHNEPSDARVNEGHAGPVVDRRQVYDNVVDMHTIPDPEDERPATRERHPSAGTTPAETPSVPDDAPPHLEESEPTLTREERIRRTKADRDAAWEALGRTRPSERDPQ